MPPRRDLPWLLVQTPTVSLARLMNKDWFLTQEAFDALLAWLDPEREAAGRKYEEIRLRLIKLFTCRGCSEPDRRVWKY